MRDYQLTIDGIILNGREQVPFFHHDETEHKLNARKQEVEAPIITRLKNHLSGKPTYCYRIILSEHVNGGEGNKEGSKLLEAHAQVNGVKMDFEEFIDRLENI